MATNNATIMGRVYLSGTNDFQQRVPDPTVAGIDATSKFLFKPNNGRYLNEFIDTYINRIGDQIIHNKEWENPLRVFKGASMRWGSSIQESAFKWIKAHTYNINDSALTKINAPEAAVWYHTVNREDRYDITLEYPDLRQAFLDEYGLNRLIDAVLTVPRNSDNYDEYLCMINQIAYYEHNWGFFKHHVSAEPTDEATGKEFLRAVRAYASKLAFPTSLYSPVSAEYGIPVFAKPEELVLFITADAMASIDVDTLAGIFNLDKAEIKYRTVVVPELPVANAFALLTTDAFFVCEDFLYANESFYDPSTYSTNYFLHHWEVVSCSPFVPAILFTTDAATGIPTLTQTVTDVNITAASKQLKPGETTQMAVKLVGTITANDLGIDVEPNAVTWSVSAETAASDGEPIALNTATRVDRLGVLHVQKSGLEAGNVLHVTGTTSYVNPSGSTTLHTKTVDITIA
nr:MAG TPA: Head protein [Bacteriophage sp.]